METQITFPLTVPECCILVLTFLLFFFYSDHDITILTSEFIFLEGC